MHIRTGLEAPPHLSAPHAKGKHVLQPFSIQSDGLLLPFCGRIDDRTVRREMDCIVA